MPEYLGICALPLLPALDHPAEAPGPKGEDPVHPADGGGAGPGALQDLGSD